MGTREARCQPRVAAGVVGTGGAETAGLQARGVGGQPIRSVFSGGGGLD